MNSNRPAPSRARVRKGYGTPPSVDGHPGWVQQSVRQYVWLTAIILAMQGFLAGAGPVLQSARSAAWWVVALGALCGMMVWLPVWGMMRGKEAVSLDEAFCEAYGRIAGGMVTMLYVTLAAFDAILALRAVGSIVRQYLLENANEIVVIIFMILALTLAIFRHNIKGLSRLNWMLRRVIVFPVMVCCLFMLQNARVDHLFPPLGNSVHDTLFSLPVAVSGFSGIVILGMLPPETGSAKFVRFRTGIFSLLLASAMAVFLVLVVNLCIPPRAVAPRLVWGHQLMIAAEYVQNRTFRLIYLLLLTLALGIAAGGSIATGSMMLHKTFGTDKGKWGTLLIGCVMVALSLQTSQRFTNQIAEWMVYRLPIAAIPPWITWCVLLIKRRRRRKEATQ